jgi:hypothetical protein
LCLEVRLLGIGTGLRRGFKQSRFYLISRALRIFSWVYLPLMRQ